MAVFVDDIQKYDWDQIKPAARRFGQLWCHMTAESDAELHAFARKLGLGLSSFQNHTRAAFRHYDLVPSKRALAVRLGAQQVNAAEHFSRRLSEEVGE